MQAAQAHILLKGCYLPKQYKIIFAIIYNYNIYNTQLFCKPNCYSETEEIIAITHSQSNKMLRLKIFTASTAKNTSPQFQEEEEEGLYCCVLGIYSLSLE